MKRIEAKSLLKAKVPIQEISTQVRITKRTAKQEASKKERIWPQKILNQSQKMSIRNTIYNHPFDTPQDLVHLRQ